MTPTRVIVILGAGGHAREVLDIFDAQLQAGSRLEVAGFLVDEGMGMPGTLVADRPILGSLDWLDRRGRSLEVIAGVGAPDARSDVVRRASRYVSRWASAIHPSVLMTRRVVMGVGVVIAAGAVLTNHIRIGNHVHLNIASTISHDSRIEDFVTVSPGGHLAGNVRVGRGAFLGIGATVIEKRSIGAWSVVGAGAVVTKDVPDNATAVGVPARVITVREAGWQQRP